MEYLSNAFSLQMIDAPVTLSVKEIGKREIPSDVVSVVGHEDTARVLGVNYNRVSVKLKRGDVLYVAQLVGGRLPEGATTLPEGYSFKFLKVELW